jgi:hypothetical protein
VSDADFLAFAARPAVSRAEKLNDALVSSVGAGALPFLFKESVKSTSESNIEKNTRPLPSIHPKSSPHS